MGSMELIWQEYEQQRRRLNARLGFVVFALLPVPAILIAARVSAPRMLVIFRHTTTDDRLFRHFVDFYDRGR